MAPSVGIDLGTSYSCVAAFRHGMVEVIANSQGSRTTPSIVAFTDKERLIGEAATYQIAANPTNTLFNVKRLIGREFSEKHVQEDIKTLPYEVINENGKIKVKVSFKGYEKKFLPEEISSMVLLKMKETAEAYIEEEVKDAVITVPAYFNDAQRRATKRAGEIAGLNVTRIINEPTAAAIAYGLNKNKGMGDESSNVLVFDLGGGTFDVSILEITDDVIEVRATAGNTHLGGEDFSNRMVNHFKQEFERKHKRSIGTDPKANRRLYNACERAKRLLSTTTEAPIEIDSICKGIDFCTTITRAKFEFLCDSLFSSTLDPVKQVLSDAKLAKENIDEIILVGGSTRIPKVQKILKDFFNNKELNKSINPDEAVAYGASIQAAILNNDPDESLRDILLLDVIPLSLGILVHGDLMSTIIKRNTTIPNKMVGHYTTSCHDQTSIAIQVFEGERPLTKNNNLLDSFTLAGITAAPMGAAKIDVTFDIDADGILKVSAIDTLTGNNKGITVTNNRGTLSDEEMKKLVIEAENLRKHDRKEVERVHARNCLETYCMNLQTFIEKEKAKTNFTESDFTTIQELSKHSLEWAQANKMETKEAYLQRRTAIEELCKQILKEDNIAAGNSTGKHMSDVVTSTKCIQHGDKIMDQTVKDKPDINSAIDWYNKAYLIAIEKGKIENMIKAWWKMGTSYKYLMGMERDIKIKTSCYTTASNFLGCALTWNSAKGLLGEKFSSSVVDEMEVLTNDFFEDIVPNLSDDRKWATIDLFIEWLGDARYIGNRSWKIMVCSARLQQVELMLNASYVTLIVEKSFHPELNFLHEISRPLQKAKRLICFIENHSPGLSAPQAALLREIRSKEEILEKDHLRYMSLCNALQAYRGTKNILNTDQMLLDDATTLEEKLDNAWIALDKLAETKGLAKEHDLEIFCMAKVKEGIIYLKYFKNNQRAKNSLKEAIEISLIDELGNVSGQEWYKEATQTLKNIQDEEKKNEDGTWENQRKGFVDELKEELKLLEDSKSMKSEQTFVDFLFSKFPPTHRENHMKLKPVVGEGESWKRPFQKLILYYHPDKIDKTKYGQKYFVLCEEITKVLNARYIVYKSEDD